MTAALNRIDRLKECAAATGQLAVLWTGNDGWILSDGQHVLATDLDFYLAERIKAAPVDVKDLGARLDLLLISHAHDDHFNAATAKALVRYSQCLFMLPASCLDKADQIGIPETRRLQIRPGQAREHLGIGFSAVRALHGHLGQSVYIGANLDDCGYYFTLAGCRIFQPGDTVLLQEHLEMPPVDVLFVSPTEHNTFIEPSCRLIEAINPRWIIAQHFNTYRTDADNYFWTRGYPEELRERLSETVRKSFIIPKAGEIYLLDPDDGSDNYGK